MIGLTNSWLNGLKGIFPIDSTFDDSITAAIDSQSDSERAVCLTNVASTLQNAYERNPGRRRAWIDDAITIQREVIRTCFAFDRAVAYSNLATSLQCLYDVENDTTTLHEAIQLFRDSLAFHSQGDIQRASSYHKLVDALLRLYQHKHELVVLEECIDLARRALAGSLPCRHHKDQAYDNLAMFLHLHYDQTGDGIALEESISMHREALALRPPDHTHRDFSCIELATVLERRFQLTSDVDSLIESIKLTREAADMRVASLDDLIKRKWLSQLATGYGYLYDVSSNPGWLYEAIQLHEEIFASLKDGYSDYFDTCDRLATALWQRYNLPGRDANLQELLRIVALRRQSLRLCPDDYADQSRVSVSLAVLLRRQYAWDRRDEILREAVGLCNHAITLTPLHATPYIELATIQLLHETPFFDLTLSLENLVIGLETGFGNPALKLKSAMTVLRGLCSHRSDMTKPSQIKMVGACRMVVDLLPVIAGMSLDRRTQLEVLRDSQSTGHHIFMYTLEVGEPAEALVLYEQARCTMWSQALHLREARLDHLPPNLASQLSLALGILAANQKDLSIPGEPNHIIMRLRDPTTPGPPDPDMMSRQARHQQASRLANILKEIRSLPGMDRFMLGDTFEEISQVTARYPVVFLSSTESEKAVALVVHSPKDEVSTPVEVIHLNIIMSEVDQLAEHLTSRHRSPVRGGAVDLEHLKTDDRGMRRYVPQNHFHQGLASLWERIVKPIVTHLYATPSPAGRRKPRLYWYPTGKFCFLPLHAAGIYQGHDKSCCSDYVVSSYAPTFASLRRAQQGPTYIKSSEAQIQILAETKANVAGLPVLSSVRAEVASIHEAAISATITVPEPEKHIYSTSMSQALGAIPSSNILHIASHGLQDTRDALESGFCLRDGRLTVSQLMDLNVNNAFLAFLSACETAKADPAAPDQVVHLAAAMLFAGFKSVIATMWAMDDIDGPNMARWVYEDLFAQDKIDSDAIAHALDGAVEKLRKAGAPPDRWATFVHMGA